MTRGRLIVFEGAEGAGKTTQIKLLAERLSSVGVPCLAVREPGGTPVGDDIREILLHPEQEITAATEALLFMASRAELVGRRLPEDEVRAANRLATAGLIPDLALLLDVPVGEGLGRADARGARDRMERADDDFHVRVGNAFREFADQKWQHSHPECGPIKLIDGTGDENTVQHRIVSALMTAFPQPFGNLKS